MGLRLRRLRSHVQGCPASRLQNRDLNPAGPDVMLPGLFSGSALPPSCPSAHQAPVQGIRFLRRKKKCPDASTRSPSVSSWPWQMKGPTPLSKVRPSWVCATPHPDTHTFCRFLLCLTAAPGEGLCIDYLCFRVKRELGDLPFSHTAGEQPADVSGCFDHPTLPFSCPWTLWSWLATRFLCGKERRSGR